MKEQRKQDRAINGSDIAATQCFLPIFLLFGLGGNAYAVPRARYGAVNPYGTMRPYGGAGYGYPARVARPGRMPYYY